MESLEKIANGNATKIFLLDELSGVLGSIGGIVELFNNENAENNQVSNDFITPKTNTKK